jgi:hypothetical protein
MSSTIDFACRPYLFISRFRYVHRLWISSRRNESNCFAKTSDLWVDYGWKNVKDTMELKHKCISFEHWKKIKKSFKSFKLKTFPTVKRFNRTNNRIISFTRSPAPHLLEAILFFFCLYQKVCLLILFFRFIIFHRSNLIIDNFASPSICVPIADELHCWVSEEIM